MDQNKVEAVPAVEAVVEQTAEVAVEVEATQDKPVAEQPVEAVKAVEADKPAEVEKVHEFAETQPDGTQVLSVKAHEQIVDRVLSTVEAAVDSRAEFRQFVAEFGVERGADYYAKGMSFEAATKDLVKFLRAENDAMKARLAASNVARGADAPVKFSDGDGLDVPAKSGFAAVVKVRK